MIDKIKKRKVVILVFLVILFGAFLRGFHFTDWLHFELDQARDSKIIIRAVEDGIGNLPLQGPRAAGSFLRLGPASYYLEYISAKIFGATPQGISYIVLILSVLTMPFFYLLCRRYFRIKHSLGLLAIFSVSLFMIMYARFAWNPNLIPFFMIGSIYSLLRIVDEKEKRKNLWLYSLAMFIGIATQLHFLVFIALPIITVIFLLIKRPRIKVKSWIVSMFIVIFLYSPLIINDIKTGGDNVKEFFQAVNSKSDKNEHNIINKAIRNYSEYAIGHYIVISSQEKAEFAKIEISSNTKAPLKVKCDRDCKKNLPIGVVAIILFTAGIMLSIRNLVIQKNALKKDFIMLSLLWFAVTFAITTPLSYDLSPRFFLITAPVAFIFLGFILEFIDKIFSFKSLSITIVAILVLLNLNFVQKRFFELKKSPYENIEIQPDRVLKEKNRVTLKQQNMIADLMEKRYHENGYRIFLISESTYQSSIEAILTRRGILNEKIHPSKVYREGNYYLVLNALSDTSNDLKKYSSYDVARVYEMGTLKVFELKPKEELINEVRSTEISYGNYSSTSFNRRYLWKELFNKEPLIGSDGEEE